MTIEEVKALPPSDRMVEWQKEAFNADEAAELAIFESAYARGLLSSGVIDKIDDEEEDCLNAMIDACMAQASRLADKPVLAEQIIALISTQKLWPNVALLTHCMELMALLLQFALPEKAIDLRAKLTTASISWSEKIEPIARAHGLIE